MLCAIVNIMRRKDIVDIVLQKHTYIGIEAMLSKSCTLVFIMPLLQLHVTLISSNGRHDI